MITDIVLYIVGSFVAMVQFTMSLLNDFLIPQEFVASVSYFVSHLGYLTGIFNITEILSAIGWFLTFTTYWYILKLCLWVFGLIPWFGKSRSPKL